MDSPDGGQVSVSGTMDSPDGGQVSVSGTGPVGALVTVLSPAPRERRCPLEDPGGIGGYEDLIATLADPHAVDESDREHVQGLHEWAQGTAQRSGGEETFDPAHFNLDKVNDDRVIGPG